MNELDPQDASMSSPEADPEQLCRFRFAAPTLYPFAPDAAGRDFPSRIAGHRATVRLGKAEPQAIQPGTGAKWIVPRDLELTMLAAAAPELLASDSDVTRWWRRVTDWIGAWLWVAPARDVPLQRRVASVVDGYVAPGGSRGIMHFHGYQNETRASSSQFAEALVLAGADAELPTAYGLLQRAQTASRDREVRVCVIEASAAAEVAAGVAIERALVVRFGCPEAFVANVMRRTRGLVPAAGTCLDLGLKTGAEHQAVSDLAALRNRAVHAGARVDAGAANAALLTAQRMVKALSGRAAPDPGAEQEQTLPD